MLQQEEPRRSDPLVVSAIENLARLIERWSDVEGTGVDPVADWRAQEQEITSCLPQSLIRAVFGKLPKDVHERILWRHYVIDEFDAQEIEALIKIGLMKNADITRVAKDHPSDFFASPALDFLLDRGVAPPRTVWASGLAGKQRPSSLLPLAEAIADAYVLDPATDASQWLTAVLAANAQLRHETLPYVIRERAPFEQLVRYLASAGTRLTGERERVSRAEADAVIPDLAALCVEAVRANGRTGATARWAVSILLLEATASSIKVPQTAREALADASHTVHVQELVTVLRQHDARGRVDGPAAALLPSTLHVALQTYLAQLAEGDEPMDRVSRLQRFLGRKEVVEELLLLMESRPEGPIVPEQLDGVLHNVGLRRVGSLGVITIFDARLHDAADSDLGAGDPARILNEGWQLGEGETAIVMRKARVSHAS